MLLTYILKDRYKHFKSYLISFYLITKSSFTLHYKPHTSKMIREIKILRNKVLKGNILTAAPTYAVAPHSVRGVTNMTVVLMPTMMPIMITSRNKPFNDTLNKNKNSFDFKKGTSRENRLTQRNTLDIIKIRSNICN